MSVTIKVKSSEEIQEEPKEPQNPKISLEVRKTLDGKIMIFDHLHMDIIIDTAKNKITTFPKKEISDEKIFELAIDSGAKECISKNEHHEIHTNINEIYEVKKKLENEIPNFVSTELEWLPLNLVSLNGDNKDNMTKFLEALDDDDDVQNIFTNAEFKE